MWDYVWILTCPKRPGREIAPGGKFFPEVLSKLPEVLSKLPEVLSKLPEVLSKLEPPAEGTSLFCGIISMFDGSALRLWCAVPEIGTSTLCAAPGVAISTIWVAIPWYKESAFWPFLCTVMVFGLVATQVHGPEGVDGQFGYADIRRFWHVMCLNGQIEWDLPVRTMLWLDRLFVVDWSSWWPHTEISWLLVYDPNHLWFILYNTDGFITLT